MATAGTAIDEIRIEGSSEGLDDLVRDLNDVTNAQDDLGRSTRETENITDRSTRTIAAAAKANERLARTLDDGYRRTQDYSRGVSILNRGLEQGVIDAQTYAHRMELLGQRFGVTNDNARNAGNQVRLTGGQVQNLGYQLNDVATMLASGSSPFQVMATQAGQVLQALGDGPGGVRGSLAAIGSAVMGFMRGLGPAGLALGGVAVAATAFALVIKRDVKPIEDVIKRQEEAVRKLRDAYGVAGDAAEDYARRSPQAVRMSANDNYKEDLERVRKEASQKMYSIFGGPSLRYRVVQEQFEGIRKAVRAFNAEAKDGIPPFAKLEADLAQFETGGATKEAQALSKAIREWTQTYIPLEEKLRGVNDLMSDSAVRAMEMKKAYGTAMTGLLGMVPDLRTQAERINDLFADASKNGQAAGDEMVALYQKQRAMQPITDTANAAVREEQAKRAAIGLGEEATAIAEVVARYDGLRASVKGNADAIAAYDKAQQEAIAGVKDQSAFKAAEDAAKKADEAAKKAEAQAKAGQDATRARLAGMDATVRGLQTEAETLGMSEGAAAGYRFQVEALAAAKAAAGAQGVVSDEELRKINETSAAIARMTDNLAARREADAAIGQFFPLEKAAQEAERLQAMVSDTANGLSDLQRRALQLRIDQGFVDAQEAAERLRTGGVSAAEEIGKAFIENVGDVFADIFSSATRDGESFFSSLMRGAAGIGSQLSAAGAKHLFGSLFGLPQDKAAAGVGSIGTSPIVSGGGVRVGAVTSAPLAALNDNLAKTSRSALDVARQFQGLNERADSKVLDGFMQASGNWRGLSAKDTAWCAAFANAAIVQAGGKGTGSNAASSFMGWGTATTQPKVGDIVVLRPQSRGATGHVGFVAGFGDGTVQIFGGNQSNSAKVSTYSTREVVGYRTGTGTQSQGGLVSSSVNSAEVQRSIEKGTLRGIQQATEQRAPGFLYQNAQGQTVNHVGITRGQQLMGGLGAGLGIFSSGYQGADPLMGGVSGALGGFQAASALGVAGPIGAVAGAALGLLGGVLGKRKQREQEHQQKAQAWAEAQSQYQAWQKSLDTLPTTGLRDTFDAQIAEFNKFRELGGAAWKRGTNNSSESFVRVGTAMFTAQDRARQGFRDSFASTESNLLSGQGLEGPWVKARDAIRQASQAVLTFVDDTKVAFGETAPEVARAQAAGIAQLRAALRGTEELTGVQSDLQSLQGAATTLRGELVKLGMSSEDAARAVGDDLNAAIQKRRAQFEQSLSDQVESLSGRDYLAKVRDLLKATDQMAADAGRLGADTSLLPTLFKKQAQAIVDGAELAGDGFEELIRLFPQLSGVVTAFATAAESAKDKAQTAYDTARNALDRAYQAETDQMNDRLMAYRDQASELKNTIDRLRDFADQVADFRKSLLLDDNLSTLAPDKRLEEARKQFLDLAARAETDEDARSKLTGAGQTYLTELKSFYASNERYNEGFEEVQRIMARSEGSARSQLSAAESQLATLNRQIATQEAQLAVARAQYDAILGTNEGIKSLQTALAEMAVAMANLRQNGGTVTGSTGGANPVSDRSLAYLASNPDVAKAIAAGNTFGVTTGSVDDAIRAHWSIYGQYEVGHGTRVGYANGGFTGWGSRLAEAGVVHGQEFVAHAEATARWRPQLEAMNAGTFAMEASPTGGASEIDLSELRGDLAELGDRITAAIAGSGQETQGILSESKRVLQQVKAALQAA
ncbi:TIGR02594 family protein [Aureimonas sp. D3]|uniref:TIGR02594 family protein n=1 Tax=Aureimonas sp. D3 TaxID=1638164 RepID=UPI000785B431|nr:TIGR02594 family protein [Aureimonas sp. D3]